MISPTAVARDGIVWTRRHWAIIHSTGWLIADRALRLVVTVGVMAIAARVLGPQGLGALSYAAGMVTLFSSVAGLGIDSLVVRDLVRHPDRSGELLGTTFVLRCTSGALAAGTVSILAWVLSGRLRDEVALVLTMAPALLFSSADIFALWFQHRTRNHWTVIARLIPVPVSAGARVLLLMRHADLKWFALVGTLESAIAFACMGMAFRRDADRPVSWTFSTSVMRQLLHEGWPLLLASISVTLYMRVDQVLVPLWAGTREAGIYGAAVRVSELWYIVPTALVQSVFPSLVTARQRGEAEFSVALVRLFRLMALLGVGVAATTTLVSRSIVVALYGHGFAEAGTVLAIHVWAGLFVALGTARSLWDATYSQTQFSLHSTAEGAVLNVGLNWLLVPKYGAVGSAIATLLAYAHAAVGATFIHRRARPVGRLFIRALSPFRWLAGP